MGLLPLRHVIDVIIDNPMVRRCEGFSISAGHLDTGRADIEDVAGLDRVMRAAFYDNPGLSGASHLARSDSVVRTPIYLDAYPSAHFDAEVTNCDV